MSAAAPDIHGLLAGLMGGGGPPQGPPGLGGPPGPGASGPEPANDPVPDLLQQAIDALHKAFAAETEPIDKEMISKALVAVQSILSQEQKDKNSAMGGTGTRLLMRNR